MSKKEIELEIEGVKFRAYRAPSIFVSRTGLDDCTVLRESGRFGGKHDGVYFTLAFVRSCATGETIRDYRTHNKAEREFFTTEKLKELELLNQGAEDDS